MHGGWLRYILRQEAVGWDVAGLVVGGRRESGSFSGLLLEEGCSSSVLWDRARFAAAAGKEMHTSQLQTSAPGRPATRSSLVGGRLTSTGDTVGYTPGKALRSRRLFCGRVCAEVVPVAGLR